MLLTKRFLFLSSAIILAMILSIGTTFYKSISRSFSPNRHSFISQFLGDLKYSSSMASEYTITYVTAPSGDVAKQLSKQLVENRLAACVNIVKGIESVYEWKDKIEVDNEALLIIKSHSDKVETMTQFIEKNHPYDCPEVVTLKMDSGSKPYLDWILETVNKKPFGEPETGGDTV